MVRARHWNEGLPYFRVQSNTFGQYIVTSPSIRMNKVSIDTPCFPFNHFVMPYSLSYHTYYKSITRKCGVIKLFFFSYKLLKLKLRVILAGCILAMVTCHTNRIHQSIQWWKEMETIRKAQKLPYTEIFARGAERRPLQSSKSFCLVVCGNAYFRSTLFVSMPNP